MEDWSDRFLGKRRPQVREIISKDYAGKLPPFQYGERLTGESQQSVYLGYIKTEVKKAGKATEIKNRRT